MQAHRLMLAATAVGVALTLMSPRAALAAQPTSTQGDSGSARASDEEAVLRWALEVSAAAIGSGKTLGLIRGGSAIEDGPAGGWVWTVGGSYVIHEFDWGKKHYHPHFETAFAAGLIDQDGGSSLIDVRADLVFRWRDFPWNEHVFTTIGAFGGLAQVEEVPLIDAKRHSEDKNRSTFRFHARLEFTFAPPSHPEHEILLFNDHWSGGGIFDQGGWDSYGIGYRRRF